MVAIFLRICPIPCICGKNGSILGMEAIIFCIYPMKRFVLKIPIKTVLTTISIRRILKIVNRLI